MKVIINKIDQSISLALQQGGVGVLPTDTLYGLVGSALNKKTVGRIYKLKKRAPQKPFIILIANVKDLALFGVKPDRKTKDFLRQVWPGPVSVVLSLAKEARTGLGQSLTYLRRGLKTLAFRRPSEKWLLNLLKKTGPLVAPSANWEGQAPASNIQQAKGYFSDQVDFYCDAGILQGQPSTLVAITQEGVKVLRQGQTKIKISNF